MLFPKHPIVTPARTIYKGHVEEGPGQYPIAKTVDWVEDMGTMGDKLYFASKAGFIASSAFAIVDIRTIKKITERKAQLARYAFFAVPITGMAAGWMGGVEMGKIALGRKDERAWVFGASVPAGIFGIWRRDIYKGVRTGLFLAALGYAYQYSCNNDLTNSLFSPDTSNPNIPNPNNPFNRDWTMWNLTTKSENPTFHVDAGWYFPDPGPSWKKWEDKKE
eukprot:GFUD01023064.1.p1 GENE.GFUD01023064.1~~GFUD01023064.1.p1  ORF type:complete len:220 (+),score=59.77 GFUD01023064.1:61-720(+)